MAVVRFEAEGPGGRRSFVDLRHREGLLVRVQSVRQGTDGVRLPVLGGSLPETLLTGLDDPARAGDVFKKSLYFHVFSLLAFHIFIVDIHIHGPLSTSCSSLSILPCGNHPGDYLPNNSIIVWQPEPDLPLRFLRIFIYCCQQEV